MGRDGIPRKVIDELFGDAAGIEIAALVNATSDPERRKIAVSLRMSDGRAIRLHLEPIVARELADSLDVALQILARPKA